MKINNSGSKSKPPTRGQAIRLKCIDCSGGSLKEVRLCPCTDCWIYPFRMGRGPKPGDFDKNLEAAPVFSASAAK